MTARYLSANTLLECRMRTTDGGIAVLRDFIIDTSLWSIGFLAAEVEGWAPNRYVLLLPADVAGVDEARSEIELSLDAASLRDCPTLAVDNGPANLDEDMAPPAGWDSQWAADADPEGTGETPAAAPDPVRPRAIDLGDSTDCLRAETLRGYDVETADGIKVRVLDLLIDDTDWGLAYLELDVGPNGNGGTAERAQPAMRCLVPRRTIDTLDRGDANLHIAVWADELRQGEIVPHPAAPDQGAQVRMLQD